MSENANAGDGDVEETHDASTGPPAEANEDATRAVLAGDQPYWLTENELDRRQAAMGTERKPMGPPLEDEDEGDAARAAAPPAGEAEAIDEPSEPAD